MSVKIFYFSGTGNSFYVAKMLANHFLNNSVESIAEYQSESEIVVNDEEIIIISPIYFPVSFPSTISNWFAKT